jgi:hypothetical protein
MKFGRGLHLALEIFLLAVGLATVILSVNEATVDVLDRMGSNYWLAWCATISGIATLFFTLHWHSSRGRAK